MTTVLQRVYISKINLSIQPLYFVLLTYTLSSLRLRVLCYFKAISASCVSRHAISLPSDARVESGEEAPVGPPSPTAYLVLILGLSRNFSSCCLGLTFHLLIS